MNPLEWIAGGGRAGGERKTKRKDLRGKSEGVGGEGWTIGICAMAIMEHLI